MLKLFNPNKKRLKLQFLSKMQPILCMKCCEVNSFLIVIHRLLYRLLGKLLNLKMSKHLDINSSQYRIKKYINLYDPAFLKLETLLPNMKLPAKPNLCRAFLYNRIVIWKNWMETLN